MNPRARVQLVMWFALLMSIVIYLFLAWFTVAPKTTGSLEDALGNPVVLLLWGAAVLAFLGGFAIKGFFAPREPEFPQATVSTTPRPAVAPWRIMQWAIFESAAIFGLIAAFISQVWTAVLPPVALAIAGFVMTFPGTGEE